MWKEVVRTGRSWRGVLACALLLAAAGPVPAFGAPAGVMAVAAAAVPVESVAAVEMAGGAMAAGAMPGGAIAAGPVAVASPVTPQGVLPAAPHAAALLRSLVARETGAVDDGMREKLRAALAEASAAKREAKKLAGEERAAALLAVTARYAAIAEDTGYAEAGRAEAAFRAGELLRSDKNLEEAAVMFARATELGGSAEGGEEFAARALLESAHLKRRAKDVGAALTLYAAVGERFPAEKRSAAHAVTWQGKLQLQADQREQGIATLLRFREQFPEYPAEAVRNADLVALEQLEAGDEPGARRTVEEIRAAMEGVIAAGGKQAESVSKALTAMRVTEQLAGD